MARIASGTKAIPKHGYVVSAHNTNELSISPATIYIGGGGNIAVVTAGGETLTFVGVIKGTILPVKVRVVKSTGTTASNLIALY